MKINLPAMRSGARQVADGVPLVSATEQNVAVIDQASTMVDYLDAVVTRMRKAVLQYGG